MKHRMDSDPLFNTHICCCLEAICCYGVVVFPVSEPAQTYVYMYIHVYIYMYISLSLSLHIWAVWIAYNTEVRGIIVQRGTESGWNDTT